MGDIQRLASPVENLSPEVDELHALVHRLQAENHEFRQQAGYWKNRHRNNLKRITALERKVEPTPMVFRAFALAHPAFRGVNWRVSP